MDCMKEQIWCASKLEELQKYFDHPNRINYRNGYINSQDLGDIFMVLVA